MRNSWHPDSFRMPDEGRDTEGKTTRRVVDVMDGAGHNAGRVSGCGSVNQKRIEIISAN